MSPKTRLIDGFSQKIIGDRRESTEISNFSFSVPGIRLQGLHQHVRLGREGGLQRVPQFNIAHSITRGQSEIMDYFQIKKDLLDVIFNFET